MFGRIYKITNNVNDIVYIGQTIEDLNIRLSKHKYEIKREKSYFYKEMTKNFKSEPFGKDRQNVKPVSSPYDANQFIFIVTLSLYGDDRLR